MTRPAVSPVIAAKPTEERSGELFAGGVVLKMQAPLPVTVQVADKGR